MDQEDGFLGKCTDGGVGQRAGAGGGSNQINPYSRRPVVQVSLFPLTYVFMSHGNFSVWYNLVPSEIIL